MAHAARCQGGPLRLGRVDSQQQAKKQGCKAPAEKFSDWGGRGQAVVLQLSGPLGRVVARFSPRAAQSRPHDETIVTLHPSRRWVSATSVQSHDAAISKRD